MGQVIFYPCKIRKWNGRYGRIEGKDYVFHIKWNPDLRRWWICISQNTQDSTVLCWAHYSNELNKLVEAVNKGKRYLVPGHQSGGSFLINEYGQVLVPASDGSRERVIVGEVEGKILFRDALTDKLIDLSECGNIKLGDQWDKPYIGIPYNLSKNNRIYFSFDIPEGKRPEYLDKRYEELIKKLRHIRTNGPVRFIVNPYGIVLTKIPKYSFCESELLGRVSVEEWLPVFVCKINYNYWFQKEG